MRSTYFRTSFLITALFIIALFILLFLASVVYRQFLSLNESSKWVTHSQQVDLELEHLLVNIKDAETGQRGYLLSHDTSFLKPYTNARYRVNFSLAKLKLIMVDNPEQQVLLDTLYRQINERLSMLNSTLKMADQAVILNDTLREQLVKGKQSMDRLLETITRMSDSETKLLESREQKLQNDITITPWKSLLLVIFSLLVFTFSFFKISRDVKRYRETNDKLMIMNKAFEHAEEIAGISNWQLDLDSGNLEFSDNQYRMLGCEGRCFDPSFENFLDFVHPDDRVYLRNEWEKTLNGQGHYSLFRVIRQDSEVRYVKSIGKSIFESGQRRIIVGINWDITDLHLNNIRLEEKNRELETSNAELASFNHIASHDLQEPLRKIQMFISRIIERDMPFISEASKEAFDKIQNSAQHMQNLIDDLLMFSRTNRANQLFEKSDLNILLDNAIQELATVIEEKNAVVRPAELPRLSVIPFQIQQLFINIMSNSLKFTRKDVQPEISVSSEIIRGKDLLLPSAIPRKRYWKITFTDNGIGFDNQYSEKIFVLFHRLHDKTEFSGTGIGLAICKKIADNHGGFITAEGIAGEGASFTIFLPVN